jgi:hypothetical protein
MKLTQDIKRMLNALAYANAGDYLSATQKSRCLAGASAQPQPTAPAPASRAARSQVGLYLGSELTAEVMQYVVQTCARLRHGLTVLTFLTESEAQELLTPHRPELDAAGIELTLLVLAGEPPAGLVQGLRHHPEVAFLVVNEAGYLGHGLLHGTQRQGSMPVPVVMVAAQQAAAAPDRQQATEPGLARVA